MQTAFQAKKTPVTLLALAIGLALQMQPGAVLAQQTTKATTDAPAQGNDPAAAAAQAAGAQTATPAQDQGTELDSVVVTGSYRISLEKALDIKRTEKGVVDAIVADDVGKFPDLNLAESLQRVPGVTVMRDAGEGRQISVRGLNADFTRVRINGMEALATIGATDGSGGVNRGRSFDFNTFASELFSQMLVRKTASPEVEEGSLGATVDLRTARPFDYEGFTFSASGQMGYSDLADDAKPRGSMLISNTWADRRFGALFSVAYTDRTTVEEGAGSGRWAQGTSNGGFDVNSPYAPALLKSTMHPRFPRYILQEHDQKRLGISTSLQFAPSSNTEISLDALYAKFKANRTEDYIEAISFSRGASGKRDTIVLDGALDQYNNLVYGLFDNVDVRSESRFDKATTTFTQVGLSFDHQFSDDFSMSGLAGRSKSDFDKPIETTIIMDKLNVDGYSWDYRGNSRLPVINYGVSPTDPTGWTLAEVRVRPSRVVNTFDNAQLDFDWGISPGFRLKGGVLSKKYVFDSNEWRRSNEGTVPTFADGTKIVPPSWVVLASLYGINAPGNSTWVVPDYEKFVREFNVNGNTGIFAVADRPANTRSVEEKDNGVYLQGEFNIDLGSIPLSGNFGVRYVKTKQTSTGFALVGTPPVPVQATVEREYTDTLPSFNLVAEITPDFLIRLAGAKVMARPGLGFLTPGVTVSVSGGSRNVSGGNPNLDPFRATTGDLSFEWYFQEGALLGLGLFYKDIESFVQTASETRPYSSSGLPVSLLAGTLASPDDDFNFRIPLNTPGGPLKGVELNYQQSFRFLPGKWSNLGVQFNYTYVDSKIQYLKNDGSLSLKTDLTGLSRNAYGATLYYDGDRFSGRVSAAKRDDYLTTVPATDDGNDVQGTHGTTNIDASLSWKLNDHWELTLEGLNLTNEWASTWNDSVAQRVESYTQSGRQYLVGARFKF